MSPDDIAFIVSDLTVKPEVHGGPSSDAGSVAFPIYRESEKKLYIPRFYGIARYGLPEMSEIHGGEDIDVPFAKPLRDYQDNIVDVYMRHVNKQDGGGANPHGGGAILEVPCGRGKCLAYNTEVMMSTGAVKKVQDIQVGETLMGDDSTPRTVLSLARGRERMYRIRDLSSPIGNIGYTVNEQHILSLRREGTASTMDISVADYLDRQKSNCIAMSVWKGYRVAVDYANQQVPSTDPYIYGRILAESAKEIDMHPEFNTAYRFGSIETRKQVLNGILSVCGGRTGIVTIYNPLLLTEVISLARSVGYFVSVLDNTQIMINMEPKNLLYRFAIDELDVDEYYGFEIDGNRRFVLGDYTVTHNTVMALKIMSLIGKKTLILVHKEFLMNQWIERIAEFLPTATVGKIQGQVFDVAGKDIVIGMIQTMYDKEYSADTFACFGLTVIDEVHRIGSEQFSRALLKIITPYMLGISATVTRKDGLTRVLHAFIGETIYSEDREHDDPVCVRAIDYVSRDPEFNEIEYDFRGEPKHSTMLSKLSNYGPRRAFIAQVIADLITEHPDNQIMILAHQRAILTYLYETIQQQQIADGSVGYYVGGMKEDALKTTESKRIVLATFAMAAEALDIKTLSTLVMVTPKTDIIQSVGRILRVKHANPIVVDIVDAHDMFRKQWVQRRRFYKKCGYRIRQMGSDAYIKSANRMRIDWNTDTTWTRVHEPSSAHVSEPCADDEDDDDKPRVRQCMIDIEGLTTDLC